jgi:TRAP-type C4-dicarboxylate transport system permease small subunit
LSRGILIVIFLLNLYQVGGRYLFGVGEIWIPDLTRFLFIWMVFLGTALMHLRNKHLVIDFVQLRMPHPIHRATQAVISAGMLGMAGVMAVVGWRIMQIRMDIPYTGLEIPRGMRTWPCRWLLCSSAHQLAIGVEAAGRVRKGAPERDAVRSTRTAQEGVQ